MNDVDILHEANSGSQKRIDFAGCVLGVAARFWGVYLGVPCFGEFCSAQVSFDLNCYGQRIGFIVGGEEVIEFEAFERFIDRATQELIVLMGDGAAL